MEHKEIIIIGSGITGLLCATRLVESSKDVIILEKEPQVGGRMSTFQTEQGSFDHGVQFFTARDLRFQMYADDWLEKGLCKTWFVSDGDELGAQGYVRYCGVPNMLAPAQYLSEAIDVRLEHAVKKVTFKDEKWIVTCTDKSEFSCNSLILTAPLPVSLDLLEKGNSGLDIFIHDELKGIRYQKRITLLVSLEDAVKLNEKGLLHPPKGSISWISDNYQKGISPNGHTLTIQSTAQFAESNWHESKEEITRQLLKELQQHVNASAKGTQCLHWKHAFPINPWHDLFFKDPDRNLYLAGDAFGGARVEGAALSGIQTADEILEQSIMEKS